MNCPPCLSLWERRPSEARTERGKQGAAPSQSPSVTALPKGEPGGCAPVREMEHIFTDTLHRPVFRPSIQFPGGLFLPNKWHYTKIPVLSHRDLVTRRGFEPRTHCLKGSCRRMPESKSGALPLGDIPMLARRPSAGHTEHYNMLCTVWQSFFCEICGFRPSFFPDGRFGGLGLETAGVLRHNNSKPRTRRRFHEYSKLDTIL